MHALPYLPAMSANIPETLFIDSNEYNYIYSYSIKFYNGADSADHDPCVHTYTDH